MHILLKNDQPVETVHFIGEIDADTVQIERYDSIEEKWYSDAVPKTTVIECERW